MSAAYAPDPDDRRDDTPPSGDLSARDRKILDDIAGHENGSDPAFVARLREPARRSVSPAAERVIQVLVVAAVAAFFVPTTWLVVGLIVLLMVVGPALLAWYGHTLEQGRRRAPDEAS